MHLGKTIRTENVVDIEDIAVDMNVEQDAAATAEVTLDTRAAVAAR